MIDEGGKARRAGAGSVLREYTECTTLSGDYVAVLVHYRTNGAARSSSLTVEQATASRESEAGVPRMSKAPTMGSAPALTA